MENLSTTNLKPNVRTIGITGGTGVGKTDTSALFSALKAKPVIRKGVGITNSTLKERSVVFTEKYSDKIIVAAKLNDELMDKNDFIDLIVTPLTSLIIKKGKIFDQNILECDELFKKILMDEINTMVNSKAILSFLDDLDGIVNDISEIIKYHDFYSKNHDIYSDAKNQLNKSEIKDNSTKLIGTIKRLVALELERNNNYTSLWNTWEKINTSLMEVFFIYFSKNNVSKDGFYFKSIDLNNTIQDVNFVDAMFTSNDLRSGENLSLEVLCSELVIYVPLHETIADIIKSKETSRRVFSGKDGLISIGLFDTRGLYHKNSSDNENSEYLTDLLYDIRYDALMLVYPMAGDTNEVKLRELYSKTIQQFSKQVPIFLLNNKVDLFIDTLSKELDTNDDPLTLEVTDKELSFKEVTESINLKLLSIQEELIKKQHKNRMNSEIITLPCCLKRGSNMTKEMINEYNVKKSITKIIEVMSQSLYNNSEKLNYRLKESSINNIEIEIDKNIVHDLIEKRINSQEVFKKVLKPALIDISDNFGKIPHGNGYNALRRRLQHGNGYTSNIDEAYFYYCKSFSINFPGNLRNFISKDFLNDVLESAVQYKGGIFENAKSKKVLNDFIVNDYYNAREFVANMLFHHAMKKAEDNKFSPGTKFEAFLKISRDYFNLSSVNMTDYSEVVIETLKSAINSAIDFHIYYS